MPETAMNPSRFTQSTTCSFCGTGCTLSVTLENGQMVEVKGDKRSPVNRGETCVKGTQAWKYVQSERRIRQPLIKRDGTFVPATWDEALTAVAEGLRQVREQNGADAIGCLSSSRATNEMNFLAQKLMRQVIGTNNIDSCNRT